MAAPSRTAQFARLHKILKKHYSPVAPAPSRTVLEQLLFGCCLENAQYRAAEEAFAAMIHTFYDWNEIRVSSMRELAELTAGLPDPTTAAHRFKRILQSIFEATYAFDLEELRKLNWGRPRNAWKRSTGPRSSPSPTPSKRGWRGTRSPSTPARWRCCNWSTW